MLKKIVFLLADAGQREAAERMRLAMGKDGEKVEIQMLGRAEASRDAEICRDTEASRDADTEDTVYVTDSGKALQELKECGKHVIALLHKNNEKEDLSQTPYAVSDVEELSMDYFEKIFLRLTGKPWDIMETKRCIIREMTVADVDDFYRIYAEPSITYYLEDLYERREEEREYTREYIEKVYGFYGYGLWTVNEKKTGEIIGRAGLSWREGFELPELGFVIAVPWQRKGYGYEVCRAVVKYGRETLGFCEIQALVKSGNSASAGLCEKLGFRWIDTVEDKGISYERYVLVTGQE